MDTDNAPTREIVEGNLAKMLGGKKGEMQYLLIRESRSGNAGTNCSAANFYFDKETGEIKYFGNMQDVPKDIVNSSVKGIFIVWLDPDLKQKSRIIEKIYDLYQSDPNSPVRINLRESVRRYNSL